MSPDQQAARDAAMREVRGWLVEARSTPRGKGMLKVLDAIMEVERKVNAALRTTPPPPAAAPGEITQEQALLAAEQRGMDVGLQWAAYIASMACLVPPDGGSPSEEEAAVCEEAERRILSLVGRKPSVVDLRHYERKAADIRAALAGVPRE